MKGEQKLSEAEGITSPAEGGSSPLAAVPTSKATLGYPSTMSEKHTEMTATTADPGGSRPHQFSLELKETSQWHFRKAQRSERNKDLTVRPTQAHYLGDFRDAACPLYPSVSLCSKRDW